MTIRVSKKGFKVVSKEETVSPLVLTIQIHRIVHQVTDSKKSERVDTPGTIINAPNAQIVTNNQIGNNTVNNFDTSAKLKATAPSFDYKLSMNKDRSVLFDLRLLNDVPIFARCSYKRADNIPVHMAPSDMPRVMTIYRNNGVFHRFPAMNFLDSQFPQDSTFRIVLIFEYESIYFTEMQISALHGSVKQMVEIDPRSNTIKEIK